jgi:FAD/FMN-containing dehydrogenase
MAAPWLTTEDVDWNVERAVFNILVDQQPAGIAVPRSADDVSDVVRSAAAEGKRVAAQRTGAWTRAAASPALVQCGAAWFPRQHRAGAHGRPRRRQD